MNAALRDELLAMAAEGQRVRAELAADGSLFDSYHPKMAEAHAHNAARLTAIIEQHGWPGRSLVGEDGARAAWLVLQHAIGNPDMQRRGLVLLQEAAARGEVPPAEVAMLHDRICYFEARPQKYGTQYDWSEDGELAPWVIEEEARVDERRRAVVSCPRSRRTPDASARAPLATARSRRRTGRSGTASSWNGPGQWAGGSSQSL